MNVTREMVEDARLASVSCIESFRKMEEQYGAQTVVPLMRKQVGRCFKYRNCYSCPQKESDYWHLYCKIIGVKDGVYDCLQFQTDQYGRVEVGDRQGFHPLNGDDLEPRDGWVEIKPSEFRNAARAVANDVKRYLTRKE